MSTPILLQCECHSDEHIMLWDHDPQHEEVILSVFLSHETFLARLKNAIRYLFGYKCRYGHFDTMMLGQEKLKELKTLCEAAIK